MTERRFRELVNLHLDHALSEAEAVELEAELRISPERRRLLRSYERMDRCCVELFRRYEQGAPAPEPLLRALRRAEERMSDGRVEKNNRGWNWIWAALGGAGAVAAVALLVAPLANFFTGGHEGRTGAVLSSLNPDRPLLLHGPAIPPSVTMAAVGINPAPSSKPSGLSAFSDLEFVSDADLERAALWSRVARLSETEGRPIVAPGIRSATVVGTPFGGFEAVTAGFYFQR